MKKRKYSDNEAFYLVQRGAGLLDFNYYIVAEEINEDVMMQVEVMTQMIFAGYMTLGENDEY